jgi:uncharacterized protein YfaS (alpha-2-macroglobulin family)
MRISAHFVAILLVLCTSEILNAQKDQKNHEIGDSLNFIEKVWLHVDRDRYNTGDDIWFKAYLVDGSNMLTDNSFNLHVELIAPKQKIVDSRIIRLTDGLGNGDFKLSDNLQSGLYHLRAYTTFM